MKWNPARFAEALLPLISDGAEKAVQAAKESLAHFDQRYEHAYLGGLRRKLGLRQEIEGDLELGTDLLARMAENQTDFTLMFRRLSESAADIKRDADTRTLFANPTAFDDWDDRWRARLSFETESEEDRAAAMRSVNPRLIPRNHRIEAAIAEAETGRFQKFHELVDVLSRPFDDQPQFSDYANGPSPNEVVQQTFCGT